MIEVAECVPHESLTGLPYLVAPPKELPTLERPYVVPHHLRFSPQGYPYYEQVLQPFGQAVKDSYIQWIPPEQHSSAKEDPRPGENIHDTWQRTKTARSLNGQVREIMFSTAKAVSSKVIDFEQGEIRGITDEEKARLFRSHELRTAHPRRIREAFVRFSVQAGLRGLSRAEINALDNALNSQGREAITDGALETMVRYAFALFDERYEEARKAGLLPPRSPLTPAGIGLMHVRAEPRRFRYFGEEMNLFLGRESEASTSVANSL